MENLEYVSEKQPLVPVTSAREIRKIIIASCLGTLIEWYDFFLFATLATTIASKFFNSADPTSNVIAVLATSAIGFGVRPLGALGLMGLATALVGCLPTVQDIGVGAGGLLLILRIIQGLALGGEYSGAATYIAEYAPANKRGYYTSFIQTTATGGLIISLVVILIVKNACGAALFDAWGWRIPFLFSVFLVGISIYIRLALQESPMFQRLRDTGKLSKNPLFEAFGNLYNLKFMALALFGACMGQGVVWYTSQFYALYFLQTIFKLPFNDSYFIVGVALLLVTPFFVIVGKLSDMYGRKPFMVAGLVLAITTYYPIYLAMYQFRYSIIATTAAIKPADIVVNPDYNPYALCFFVWLQTVYVTLIYGPIAAFLVELFPTSIRYTSMSFPYHIGNGICGGFVPVIGLLWIKSSGNIYAGLYYPFITIAICLIIMVAFVPETYENQIFDTLEEKRNGKEDSATIVETA